MLGDARVQQLFEQKALIRIRSVSENTTSSIAQYHNKMLITARPLQDNLEKETLSYISLFLTLHKTGQFYAKIIVVFKSIHFK